MSYIKLMFIGLLLIGCNQNKELSEGLEKPLINSNDNQCDFISTWRINSEEYIKYDFVKFNTDSIMQLLMWNGDSIEWGFWYKNHEEFNYLWNENWYKSKIEYCSEDSLVVLDFIGSKECILTKSPASN